MGVPGHFYKAHDFSGVYTYLFSNAQDSGEPGQGCVASSALRSQVPFSDCN